MKKKKKISEKSIIQVKQEDFNKILLKLANKKG